MAETFDTGIRIPCGIADRSCEFGYVSTASGMVQVRLATGRQGWATEEAGRPVAISGTKLFALRLAHDVSALQLIGFDTSPTPQPVFVSEPIRMPIPQFAASNFDSIDVEAEGSALLLRWVVHKAYKGGAPPPEHIKQRESGTFAGAVRVDVRSGKVDAVTTTARSGVSTKPGELEMSPDGNWRSEPWRVNGATAVLMLSTPPSEEQRLAIEMAPDDRSKPDTIAVAQGTALVVAVSLDGGHLLVRDDGPGAKQADWRVFSIRERTWVAIVTHEEGTREASVCGGRLLYLVKQLRPPEVAGARGNVATMLKARDLAQNRPLWSFLLREETSSPPRLRL